MFGNRYQDMPPPAREVISQVKQVGLPTNL
jgi:hypothetical protein